MAGYQLGETDSFEIQSVYGEVDDELVVEVLALWARNGIIWPQERAERRARQAVCVARDKQGQLFGLNSVFEALDGQDKVLDYRLFVEPRSSGNWTVHVLMTQRAFEILNAALPPNHGYLGLRAVIENKKLIKPRVVRRFRWAGFEARGLTSTGLLTWFKPF